MPIALEQSNSGWTGTNPRILTYTNSVKAHSLLVAAIAWNSATETMIVNDSGNGNWTAIGSAKVGVGSLAAWQIEMFYIADALAGSTTVSATASGVADPGMALHEYSGIRKLSPLNGSAYNTVNSASPASSALTVNANDLIFSMCVTASTLTAAGTGYTLRENANFGVNGTEDQFPATGGSQTAGYSCSGTPDNIIGIATFVASAYPLRSQYKDYEFAQS